MPRDLGGGLDLPRTLGLTDAEQAVIQSEWDTHDAVEKILLEKGFRLERPQPPFECPEITTARLVTASNEEFSELFAQVNAWYEYARPMLAGTRSLLLQVQNTMGDIAEQYRSRIREDEAARQLAPRERMTEQGIKNIIVTDELYRQLAIQEQFHQQMKIRLEGEFESIERSLKMISRQIEVRKSEIELNRTEGNMAARNRQQTNMRMRERPDPPE